jgi:hypothetical protein
MRPLALLYFSPDSIMPLASAVAGAIGILLIFWRQLVRLARKAYRFTRSRFGSQRTGPEDTTTPATGEPPVPGGPGE